jgi:site-specific DNA-methyltransferase (adenine-specific)
VRTENLLVSDSQIAQKRLKFGNPWDYTDFVNGKIKPVLNTSVGVLFGGDCLKILPLIKSGTIDLIFADPPFNLGKEYGSKVNDKLPDEKYIDFSKKWIFDCVRVLKDGGAFFTYNLPKWNIIFGAYLFELGLTFRHWIAINIKAGLPIQGRLYPAHYSLLYFSKGKAKTFRKIRTQIEKCRHCGGEIKDYGGHRNAMNPLGVNLTDIWNDIPPVRHWKFKNKKRKANQLSTKLLSRVVHMSTNKGDVVLDPFGGSGTTFDVCENEGRHWIGIELESYDVIIERLESGNLHYHPNSDYVE